MRITNIAEAKASLSKLVERVLQGEEVIIGRAGKPVAKLVAYESDASPRDLDQAIWKGRVWMADDFDDYAADVRAAFEGPVEPTP